MDTNPTRVSDYSTQPVTTSHQDHPFANARLLRSQNVEDPVPVALLCIAPHEEIYGLMTSALMQRRALGINKPLLGLTFSPGQWTMNALYGWLTPTLDHNCVRVMSVLHQSTSA